jgi:hypothetical protein
MTAEVEVNNAVPEVVPQQTEASQQPQATETKASPQKENFARLRKQKEQLESELVREREIVARMMAMQQTIPAKQEVDELDAIGGEEYINKGKIAQLVEKRAKSIAEETVKRETDRIMQEQRNSQFLDRLKRQYSDFDDVVNPETLALLEDKNPELAETIAELKDPYKIGLQSYNYIKAMNLVAQAPDARRLKDVEKKIEENSKTVTSPQVFDKRPMAQAFQVSDAQKKELYREMMGYASQAGGAY